MIDFIITEPNVLVDSPERCYKIPFAATEALCTDVEHIKSSIFSEDYAIMSKLFTFITDNFNSGATTINHTLGGYFNKIVSFWLIKEP